MREALTLFLGNQHNRVPLKCLYTNTLLECVDGSFPAQMIKEPMMGGTLLALVPTTKEELVRGLKQPLGATLGAVTAKWWSSGY